jgi:hypothetical protein
MRSAGFHHGIDVMFPRLPDEPTRGPNGSPRHYMPDGVPALSPLTGRVASSEERFTREGESRGWGVVVEGVDGWSVFINHIVKGTQKVAKGDTVEAGEILGEIGGSVGNQGPDALKHVHLGLLKDGDLVNPESYFRGWEHIPIESLEKRGLVYAVAGGLVLAWLLS